MCDCACLQRFSIIVNMPRSSFGWLNLKNDLHITKRIQLRYKDCKNKVYKSKIPGLPGANSRIESCVLIKRREKLKQLGGRLFFYHDRDKQERRERERVRGRAPKFKPFSRWQDKQGSRHPARFTKPWFRQNLQCFINGQSKIFNRAPGLRSCTILLKVCKVGEAYRYPSSYTHTHIA